MNHTENIRNESQEKNRPKMRGKTAYNKAQPGTRGHTPHCGFANGLRRLRGNSNSILIGANFAKNLRPLAQNRFSLRAAGAASGGHKPHSGRVLAQRACLPRPLLAGPTLYTIAPQKKTAPQERGKIQSKTNS